MVTRKVLELLSRAKDQPVDTLIALPLWALAPGVALINWLSGWGFHVEIPRGAEKRR